MNLESEFWHNLLSKEPKKVVLSFSPYSIDSLEEREL